MNISITKPRQRRTLAERFPISADHILTSEDIAWRVLYTVVAIFWIGFIAEQLYAKLTKPQPATQMTKTMETRK